MMGLEGVNHMFSELGYNHKQHTSDTVDIQPIDRLPGPLKEPAGENIDTLLITIK